MSKDIIIFFYSAGRIRDTRYHDASVVFGPNYIDIYTDTGAVATYIREKVIKVVQINKEE